METCFEGYCSPRSFGWTLLSHLAEEAPSLARAERRELKLEVVLAVVADGQRACLWVAHPEDAKVDAYRTRSNGGVPKSDLHVRTRCDTRSLFADSIKWRCTRRSSA